VIGNLLLISTLIYGILPESNVKQVTAYENGKAYQMNVVGVPVKNMHGDKIYLDAEAAGAFIDMLVDAAKDGLEIKVNLGFRTMAEQRFWFSRYNHLCKTDRRYCGRAAKPGHSTHQQGLSVDISGSTRVITDYEIGRSKDPPTYREKLERMSTKGSCAKLEKTYRCKTILYWWLLKNGPKYGYQNLIEEEPWHWTFVKVGMADVGG